MKQIFLLLCTALCLSAPAAQAQIRYDVLNDEQGGGLIFKGNCTFDDLQEEASFDWFNAGYNDYNPDPAAIEVLKKKLPSCQIVIFMGTWCDDTHNVLPKLYKTLLLSHCFTNYKMYGVDRDKKSKEGENETYKVVNVPTIIVLKGKQEVGRIVESPRESVEKDLAKLVEKL
jgi:hypothetical protein